MIPRSPASSPPTPCKPRASGDDPGGFWHEHCADLVNPARAGMIPSAVRTTASAGVNPARAGMIPAPSALRFARNCKPRASGDDPHSLMPSTIFFG